VDVKLDEALVLVELITNATVLVVTLGSEVDVDVLLDATLSDVDANELE
jgi:hypothetical protein